MVTAIERPTLPGLHAVDESAAQAADPDRERLVTVKLTFPGDLNVSYQVRGPVRVELEHQVVEVHADRDGLRIGARPWPARKDGIGLASLASAIYSAARAGTVAERERQIKALLEMR